VVAGACVYTHDKPRRSVPTANDPKKPTTGYGDTRTSWFVLALDKHHTTPEGPLIASAQSPVSSHMRTHGQRRSLQICAYDGHKTPAPDRTALPTRLLKQESSTSTTGW
jgi:hypothetical protein